MEENMDTTILLLIIIGLVVVAFVLIYFFSLKYGFKETFPGSIFVLGQFLVAVLVISIVSALIGTDSISDEIGVPVIAALAGYLLGRSYEIIRSKVPEKREGEPRG